MRAEQNEGTDMVKVGHGRQGDPLGVGDVGVGGGRGRRRREA